MGQLRTSTMILVYITMSATLDSYAAERVIVDPQSFAGPDLYETNCAVCHGTSLEGAPQGTALVGRELSHGDSLEAIVASIANGSIAKGMPAWSATLDDEAIRTLAIFVVENRSGLVRLNMLGDLTLPTEPIQTETHRLNVEPVVAGLDAKPYSIAVLPDGSIVVSEKMHGLRIVSPTGAKSELIKGTPQTHADIFTTSEEGSVEFGAGWLLDVAIHPNYDDNGWIYLHYTERCDACGATIESDNNPPTSRNVLVRGRISDGRWVDQETIWQPDTYDANYYLDVVAGGRIAFDPDGFVFITVGMKSMDGIQDLSQPYGKTHRFHDDGRVPSDNPYVDDPDALNTIWTVGHRSPQGLVFNKHTRELWGTEHGPRGGDEINRLLPGRNYGWPLFSAGQNYDGTVVAHGREASELELSDTELPVVGFTPSVAISNLVVYEGTAFPAWQAQFLVGSLKASDLFRVKIADGKLVEQEILIEDLARIRDIDVDADGLIYLLLEHSSGGRIVRLVPAGD